MKTLLKFFLIAAAVLLLSAFLAPILHNFLPFKFGRIFNRLVMIGTLAAIIIFVRIRKQDLQSAGLIGDSSALKFFMTSFISGFLLLSVLMVIEVKAGVMGFKLRELGALQWAGRLAGDLGAALLIAFIEETFFRGFIFSKLRGSFKGSIVPAVLITSVFYSLIHFISGKKPFVGPDPVFWDSIRLMAAPFKSLIDWPNYWDQAVGLFIFGIVLNALFIRTRSLYAPMGLHAGCVFFVKLDGLFADSLTNKTLFWGSPKMYDGLAGWSALALTGILLFIFLKPSSGKRKETIL